MDENEYKNQYETRRKQLQWLAYQKWQDEGYPQGRDIEFWNAAEAEHKLIIQEQLANYNAQAQKRIEVFKAAAVAGQEALKSALLINGGAAVALLAFLSNVWKANATLTPLMTAIPGGLAFFVGGVFFVALATGATFLAGMSYSANKRQFYWIFNTASMFFVVLSYIAFCLGGYMVYQAFANPPPAVPPICL